MYPTIRVVTLVALVGLFPAGAAVLDDPERDETRRSGVADPSVTPDGGSAAAASNSFDNVVVFTVQNNTGQDQPFGLNCNGTGNLTNIRCPMSVFVGNGMSQDVDVDYDVGADTTGGTVSLNAQGYEGGGDDWGSYNVTVTAYGVDVATVGSSTYAPSPDPYAGGLEAGFTVKNTGSAYATFTLTCGATGPVTCTHLDQTSVALSAGFQTTVTAYFNVAAVGSGTIQLLADGGTSADSGQYTVNVAASHGVFVGKRRHDGMRDEWRQANTSYTDRFLVKNTGNSSATYALSASCGGAAVVGSSCAVGLSTITLDPGISARVWVSYTTAGPDLTGGTVTLTATRSGGSESHTAQQAVTTVGTDAPIIAVQDVNPGTSVDRSRCLTLPAHGVGVYQCGDLVTGHALPATTSRGTARAPQLVYNSRAAELDRTLIGAWVTRTSSSTPTAVSGELKVEGVPKDQKSWNAGDWAGVDGRQIVMAANANPDTTGVYSYALEMRLTHDGSVKASTATGRVIVVNRATSPYGAGWWVAGVEKLIPLAGGDKLWVGGDASAQVYHQVNATTWAADHAVRPDTLTLVNGLHVRYLPGGTRVQFDSDGRHVRTINRLADTTAFAYDGSGNLSTIRLPSRGGGQLYTFHYTGGVLASVDAPDNRTTTFAITGGQLQQITDPDAASVTFSYHAGGNRLQGRTDKRGTVVSFAYSGAGNLDRTTLNLGVDTITQGYFSRMDRGFTSGTTVWHWSPVSYFYYPKRYESGSAYLDQYATFAVNADGTPFQVRPPASDWTYHYLEDAQYRGLTSKVEHRNNWIQTAGYDARGNLIRSTDSSTGATTLFTYDAQWDALTTQILPEGERVDLAYDATTGNRLWQQDGRGARVTFGYFNAGAKAGLLQTIVSPLSPAVFTQLDYDNMGNLSQITDPLNNTTNLFRDPVGRVVMTHTPIEGSEVRKDSTVYDVMGRPTETLAIGPPQTYAYPIAKQGTIPAETRTVLTAYDPNGNVERIERQVSPVINKMTVDVSTYAYDRANRVVAVDHGHGADSTEYDANGNVIRTRSAGGRTVTMEYNITDRLVKRTSEAVAYDPTGCAVHYRTDPACSYTTPIYPNDAGGKYLIPQDVAVFGYDVMGNLDSAVNNDSRIKRTYAPNGALLTDSLWIRNYGISSFGTHVYGLQFAYDLNGRRISATHPTNLLSGLDSVQTYGYNSIGALSSITSVYDNQYGFFYDLEGRVDSLTFPSGWESRNYDAAGRLEDRHEWITGQHGRLLHESILTYDDAGRIKTQGERPNMSGGFTLTMAYSGLGHLAFYMNQAAVTFHETQEHYRADAGGFQATRRGASATLDPVYQYSYDGLGRIDRIVPDSPVYPVQGWKPDTTYNRYDADGMVSHSGTSRYVITGEPLTSYWTRTARTQLYDGNKRLRASQTYLDSIPQVYNVFDTVRRGVFEEYWYDALGRRVLVRSRQDTVALCTEGSGNDHCESSITRFVWDGDQLLYEMKTPGSAGANLDLAPGQTAGDPLHYGWVGYTHGPGLDAPLDVMRHAYIAGADQILIPHSNGRGQYDSGTDTLGAQLGCTAYPNTPPGCADLQYPANLRNAFHVDDDFSRDIPEWWGSLIQDKRDVSGLMYMRNRYYDPQTGQFTQQDPIGIAGGVNLYGFAGGDPVNFSDPFGLMACDPPDDPCDDDESHAQRMVSAAKAGIASFFGGIARSIAAIGNSTGLAGIVRASSGTDPGTGDELSGGERLVAAGLVALGNLPGGGAGDDALKGVLRAWDKGTFANKSSSIVYHYAKHGSSQGIVNYTNEATTFFNAHRSGATAHRLASGAMGLKIRTATHFGIYTDIGTIISYGRR